MAKVSLSRAWDDTRGTFARDGKLLVAVALALVVLPQVIVGVINPNGGFGIGTLVAVIISIIGQLALIRLTLVEGTTVQGAIGEALRHFPSAIGAYVLLVLAILILCIPVAVMAAALGMPIPKPGDQPTGTLAVVVLVLLVILFFLWVLFTLLPAVAAMERRGPIAIFKRAYRLGGSSYAVLLGFAVLILLVTVALMAVAGAIGGIIGSLVSGGAVEPLSFGALVLSLVVGVAQGVLTILSSVMVAHLYAQAAGVDHASTSVPSSVA